MRKAFSKTIFCLSFLFLTTHTIGAPLVRPLSRVASYYTVIEYLAALSQTSRNHIQKDTRGVFIIAGFSGDLTKRKLLPALYELVKHGMKSVIIGLGRSDLSIAQLLEEACSFIPHVDRQVLATLQEMIHYFNTTHSSMSKVTHFIQKHIQEQSLPDRRIFYLATPSDTFCSLTKEAVESGMIQKGNKDHLIVYEKPFGKDSTSAQSLNECLNTYLLPEQQYRVDHYLTKTLIECAPGLIGYLISLGFKLLKVDLSFDEKIGIEGRGSFYEKVGVLSDVVQNHALQILATFVAGADSAAKAAFLRSLHCTYGIFGQYDGYRQEKGVDPNSLVPTYTNLLFKSNQADFPMHIQAGKKLARKTTELQVLFAKPQSTQTAMLTIRLAPEESLSLRVPLADSNPALSRAILTITFPVSSIEPYTVLLSHLISGNIKVSVSQAEIEAQWHIVDAIQKEVLPFMYYAPGFAGT